MITERVSWINIPSGILPCTTKYKLGQSNTLWFDVFHEAMQNARFRNRLFVAFNRNTARLMRQAGFQETMTRIQGSDLKIQVAFLQGVAGDLCLCLPATTDEMTGDDLQFLQLLTDSKRRFIRLQPEAPTVNYEEWFHALGSKQFAARVLTRINPTRQRIQERLWIAACLYGFVKTEPKERKGIRHETDQEDEYEAGHETKCETTQQARYEVARQIRREIQHQHQVLKNYNLLPADPNAQAVFDALAQNQSPPTAPAKALSFLFPQLEKKHQALPALQQHRFPALIRQLFDDYLNYRLHRESDLFGVTLPHPSIDSSQRQTDYSPDSTN